jgi:TonB-dependent SusC/RagA subfamily outer membrane receptor
MYRTPIFPAIRARFLRDAAVIHTVETTTAGIQRPRAGFDTSLELIMPGPLAGFRVTRPAVAAIGVVMAACYHRSGTQQPEHPAATATDSVQIAYGTKAQRDVIGSITTVDSTAIKRSPSMRLADVLVGRVPGLEVRTLANGQISLRIRGERSLLGNNEPLIVLDGVPLQPDNALFQDLDPRDVASVTVLKDAGSLAAYGSRGTNGVILITTKKR